jgi:hypothetical protein
MIPKIIHYCWFGNNPKNDEILRCIASWKKHCPDFVIKEWNEENFDIASSSFTQKMYFEKKWAFVADYVRLAILEKEGGFYLDTDMLLLQSLSTFCNNTCVLGEEAPAIISAGMIGVAPAHPFIHASKVFYDKEDTSLITIPRVLTEVFATYPNKSSLTVLSPRAFYPFDAEHIHEYLGQDLGKEVYGVHLWHYSWGSPLNKFFKKIGIYTAGKKIAELLGIKKLLKKILRFI